tara:strand:+ start:171 stop:320 length:150 start_codon:yes stop_codon:yes gene_type:complete
VVVKVVEELLVVQLHLFKEDLEDQVVVVHHNPQDVLVQEFVVKVFPEGR